MRIFLQGDPSDCQRFKDGCRMYGAFEFSENSAEHLIGECMLKHPPDAAVVLCDGAAGMEAAIVVRRLFPQMPLIWFSDDSAFGVQAYRLEAAYFAEKSVMEERIEIALRRAELIE